MNGTKRMGSGAEPRSHGKKTVSLDRIPTAAATPTSCMPRPLNPKQLGASLSSNLPSQQHQLPACDLAHNHSGRFPNHQYRGCPCSRAQDRPLDSIRFRERTSRRVVGSVVTVPLRHRAVPAFERPTHLGWEARNRRRRSTTRSGRCIRSGTRRPRRPSPTSPSRNPAAPWPIGAWR